MRVIGFSPNFETPTAYSITARAKTVEWGVNNHKCQDLDTLVSLLIFMVTFDVIRSNDMETSWTSWMSIKRCLLISRHDLETACIQRWRCPAITNPSLLWQDRRLQNVVAGNIELLWAGAGKLRGYLDIMVKRKPKHSYKLLVLVPMAMVCKM